MRCDHFLQIYFKRELLLFLIFQKIKSWEQLAESVIRPQSVVREKLLDGALIWPVNATNYNFSKRFNSIKNNAAEIRTDFRTKLVPLPESFQTVDIRFTASPMHPFESALSQNEGKKIKENAKKNRKQSILLTGGIKNSKNDKKMLQENSVGIVDRENEKSFGSEFVPATEFWSRNNQILETTNHFEKEKQIFNKMNFQRPKNTEYRNTEAKFVAMDKLESMGSENQRYEQANLLNSKKSIKPILSISETEGDGDDFDLLMNLESNYPQMLTSKPQVWSDTMPFTNEINKHIEHGKQKQTGYQSLNPECITCTVISNQPWNPLNTIAQPGKIWTSEYHIPMINRFPAPASQYQPNYQQNSVGWDQAFMFQGPIGQFVTPITPINGIFDNFMHLKPSTLNIPWMPNRGATTINRSWSAHNIKTPTNPVYIGYAESSLPALRTIPLPTAASISQTDPSFNDFRSYNKLPLLSTMTTMKANYQKIDSGTGVYNNQQQQKNPRTHLENSEIMDSMKNRRPLIPAPESLISA